MVINIKKNELLKLEIIPIELDWLDLFRKVKKLLEVECFFNLFPNLPSRLRPSYRVKIYIGRYRYLIKSEDFKLSTCSQHLF